MGAFRPAGGGSGITPEQLAALVDDTEFSTAEAALLAAIGSRASQTSVNDLPTTDLTPVLAAIAAPALAYPGEHRNFTRGTDPAGWTKVRDLPLDIHCHDVTAWFHIQYPQHGVGAALVVGADDYLLIGGKGELTGGTNTNTVTKVSKATGAEAAQAPLPDVLSAADKTVETCWCPSGKLLVVASTGLGTVKVYRAGQVGTTITSWDTLTVAGSPLFSTPIMLNSRIVALSETVFCVLQGPPSTADIWRVDIEAGTYAAISPEGLDFVDIFPVGDGRIFGMQKNGTLWLVNPTTGMTDRSTSATRWTTAYLRDVVSVSLVGTRLIALVKPPLDVAAATLVELREGTRDVIAQVRLLDTTPGAAGITRLEPGCSFYLDGTVNGIGWDWILSNRAQTEYKKD